MDPGSIKVWPKLASLGNHGCRPFPKGLGKVPNRRAKKAWVAKLLGGEKGLAKTRAMLGPVTKLFVVEIIAKFQLKTLIYINLDKIQSILFENLFLLEKTISGQCEP